LAASMTFNTPLWTTRMRLPSVFTRSGSSTPTSWLLVLEWAGVSPVGADWAPAAARLSTAPGGAPAAFGTGGTSPPSSVEKPDAQPKPYGPTACWLAARTWPSASSQELKATSRKGPTGPVLPEPD